MKPLSWLVQNQYTILLMILTGIAALVVSIKNYRRHRELRIFTFYVLFSLTQDASDFFRCMSPKGAIAPMIIEGCITLGFMLFEFWVWTYFILSHITSVKRRMIVKIIPPVAFIVLTICFIWFKSGGGVLFTVKLHFARSALLFLLSMSSSLPSTKSH